LEKFGAVIDSLVLDAGTEDRRAQQPVNHRSADENRKEQAFGLTDRWTEFILPLTVATDPCSIHEL
jgi:hypothetical protein